MPSAEELLRQRWGEAVIRDANGAPLVSPEFAAAQGRGVLFADVRAAEAADGVLGFIPGSSFLGIRKLRALARDGRLQLPVVVVSASGEDAAVVAHELEQLGAEHVAALAGGLAAWRLQGLGTSREAAAVLTDIDLELPPDDRESEVTVETVRAHLGHQRSIRWASLRSIAAHGGFSCIDGRDYRLVVGAPGGDAGEFLLLLAGIEQATGRKLDDVAVEQGLLTCLDEYGRVYMHTDTHALAVLIEALRSEHRLPSSATDPNRPDEWLAHLRAADPNLRPALLDQLLEPAHMGCGHLRLMLEYSDSYGIRKDLVRSFLRAFYRLWWAGAPELTLAVLPGDHMERAVLNVRLSDELWGFSRVPLVAPSVGAKQVFVNHPEVAAYLRALGVQGLVRRLTSLSVDASDVAAVQAAIDELAARQLGETVSRLAKDLPVFDVVFASDRAFDVSEQSK